MHACSADVKYPKDAFIIEPFFPPAQILFFLKPRGKEDFTCVGCPIISALTDFSLVLLAHLCWMYGDGSDHCSSFS